MYCKHAFQSWGIFVTSVELVIYSEIWYSINIIIYYELYLIDSSFFMIGVSLSSDFITGFCQETEEDHQQTVSLLREVSYNSAFLFAYSMRKVA